MANQEETRKNAGEYESAAIPVNPAGDSLSQLENDTTKDKECECKSVDTSKYEKFNSIDINNFGIDDILENALMSEDIFAKVCYVGIYLLKQLEASEGNCKETYVIIDAYRNLKQNHPDVVTINTNTLSVYLSVIARKQISAIRCPGKKQGYYLLNSKVGKKEPKLEPAIDGSEISKEEKLWEHHLYPILTDYLSANDQLEWVINLANQRKNHEWGNTDILTLKLIDLLGCEKYELTSFEVKLSMKSWRKDIFEAISHSLFSNRAYFTFVYVVDRDRLDPEMIIYAQKFNIGLLAMEIEEADWNKIVSTPDKINGEMFDFVEIVPAPYHVCDLNIQKNYFDKLNIHSLSELRNFHKQFANK